MYREWWLLPGPRRFLDRVARDLREGRNVVLGLPEHLPEGLADATRATVEVDGPVAWESLSATADPLRLLFGRFVPQAEPGMLQTAASLVECDEFAGKLVWLRDLSGPHWPAWRAFLKDYGHACRIRSHLDRTLFVAPLVGPSALSPPAEDVCLAVHIWRGVVDLLDMLLYVDQLLQARALRPLQKRVAAAVIARLALWDPLTGIALAHDPMAALADPGQVLRALASQRGWTEKCGRDGDGWHRGLLDEFDGRPSLHSAALALHDPEREVTRRMWVAQVGVLLPFVEERRHEYLRRYRGVLKVPFTTDRGAVLTDLLDLEIGHIEWQLADRGRGVPQEVRLLKRIRNALAHLEPLGPDLLADSALDG